MKKKLLLGLLLISSPFSQRRGGHLFCYAGSGSTGSQPSPACYCTAYHPDMCDDEAGPIPDCCRATEPGTKVEGCLCCSKKKKTVQQNLIRPHSFWKRSNEGLK